jgi:hypothetical protein
VSGSRTPAGKKIEKMASRVKTRLGLLSPAQKNKKTKKNRKVKKGRKNKKMCMHE